jgi:hypothetical protein
MCSQIINVESYLGSLHERNGAYHPHIKSVLVGYEVYHVDNVVFQRYIVCELFIIGSGDEILI